MKIIEDPRFRDNPDEVIRSYRLPIGRKQSKQKLQDHLYLRFRKVGLNRLRTKIDYYFAEGNNLVTALGCADDITYREACFKVKQILKTYEPTPKLDKNNLGAIFELYLEYYADKWKPATAFKKRKIFNSKLSTISKKSINTITLSDIERIADQIKKDKKYSALSDFCELVDHFWEFCRIRRYATKDIMEGIKLTKRYPLIRGDGYGWIDTETDLKILIRYIMGYSGAVSVKNALTMGLLSALRAGNIRNLGQQHLKLDEKGEYYLHFKKDEMKIQSNGDEYIGLPCELGKWLASLQNQELYFPSQANTPLSDAILSKSLRNFTPLEPKGTVVFHSFRKIFSTFCNENAETNELSPYEIERALSHKITGIAGIYNKSNSIKTSRKVLEWWLNYLKSMGFEL